MGYTVGTGGSTSKGMSESGQKFDKLSDEIRRQLLPQLMQEYRQFGPGSQQFAPVGGVNMGMGGPGQRPEITAGPIWNQQQIDAQVNLQRARNDQATQGAIAKLPEQMSGRGFSTTGSPLMIELQARLQGQNLAANTAAENQFRFDTAGKNAQHLLASQQAREQQYATGQGEDITRRKEAIDEDIRRRQLQLTANTQGYGSELLRGLTSLIQPLGYSKSKQKSQSWSPPQVSKTPKPYGMSYG